MDISITLTENDLRKLVLEDLRKKLGDVDLQESDINIEVKSSQNYRAEWERANFRATVKK